MAGVENIRFQLNVDAFGGPSYGEGTWESDGFITSSGNLERNEFIDERDKNDLPVTAHGVDHLSSPRGNINIRWVLTVQKHDPWVSFNGIGTWEIAGGTGEYDYLRGDGELTFTGNVVSLPPTLHVNLQAQYNGVAEYAHSP